MQQSAMTHGYLYDFGFVNDSYYFIKAFFNEKTHQDCLPFL